MWDLKALFERAITLANPLARMQLDTEGWRAVGLDGRQVGSARRLDLDAPAWAAPVFGLEIEISAEGRAPVRYQSLPVTPAAWRDITLVLGPGVTADAVIGAMRQAGGELLERVAVVSEFRAESLGVEHRAVQFRLTVRAADRTVRDEEVEALLGRVLKTLETTLDARLRTS